MSTPRRVKVTGDLYHPEVPPGAVYVGRRAPGLAASPYANPHRVGRTCRAPACAGAVHDRTRAVHLYRAHLDEHPDLADHARQHLAGRDLACWCPLPEPGQIDHCHAAALLNIANERRTW